MVFFYIFVYPYDIFLIKKLIKSMYHIGFFEKNFDYMLKTNRIKN